MFAHGPWTVLPSMNLVSILSLQTSQLVGGSVYTTVGILMIPIALLTVGRHASNGICVVDTPLQHRRVYRSNNQYTIQVQCFYPHRNCSRAHFDIAGNSLGMCRSTILITVPFPSFHSFLGPAVCW